MGHLRIHDFGEKPRTATCERGEALLQACSQHNWQCAEVLLASNVPRASINTARDKLGRYSIHLAASAGEVPVVRILLRAGASTTVSSDTGRQPLHDACSAGHVGAVKALLPQGPTPPPSSGCRSRSCTAARTL